jgi:hypothetical protein
MEIRKEDVPANAKIIRYCRHSVSDGSFIGRDGEKLIDKKAEALKKGINQFDYFFYSPHIKTWQTAVSLAIIWNYRRKNAFQVDTSKIELMLHRYRLDYAVDPQVEQQGLNFLSWLFRLPPTEILLLTNVAKRGLERSFDEMESDEMKDGKTGLLIGHESTLSLTIRFYTSQEIIAIPELDFFDFAEINSKIYLIES